MSGYQELGVPTQFQPDAGATRFDLERALSAVVALERRDPGRRVHRLDPRHRARRQRRS